MSGPSPERHSHRRPAVLAFLRAMTAPLAETFLHEAQRGGHCRFVATPPGGPGIRLPETRIAAKSIESHAALSAASNRPPRRADSAIGHKYAGSCRQKGLLCRQ